MESDEIDLYEDIRLINFWFWTENGFMVQTAEYNIHSFTSLTILEIKRALSLDIFKPPAGFQGDAFLEFWKRNSLVYDGLLLEDNATLTGIGIELRIEDFLIIKRVDCISSGPWLDRHEEERNKIIELRKKKDTSLIVGFQKVCREPRQNRGYRMIHVHTESRNHVLEESVEACKTQLLEIRKELLPKLLVDFGVAAGETDEGLDIIKSVPPGFYKIVANFKTGEYKHSFDAISDIQQLLRNYFESIDDKCHGRAEREIMEVIFERLCAAMDKYTEENEERYLRPTCISSYIHPKDPIIFVGPLRNSTTCTLPVFQLQSIGRFTILQDLINSYKHYLRSFFEFEDCRVKKLEYLIYDNREYQPERLLYEIIETKRLNRFYFSIPMDVVIIKKDKRDINDLINFIEGDQTSKEKKKRKTKKRNKAKRKNSKLEALVPEISRSSQSIEKESSIRDNSSPDLDLDEIEVNHEVLRTDIINAPFENRVYSEIHQEKLAYQNIPACDDNDESQDVSIYIEENIGDDDSDVPEITVDDIDDIDDDYSLNSVSNIQRKRAAITELGNETYLDSVNLYSMNEKKNQSETETPLINPEKIAGGGYKEKTENANTELSKENHKRNVKGNIIYKENMDQSDDSPSEDDVTEVHGDSICELQKENDPIEKDTEIEKLEQQIIEQEESLQQHKDYIETLIEAKGTEMKKIIISISESENEENTTMKKISENESKIEELKLENEKLLEESENQKKIIDKFEKKKHKLENFIDMEMDKFREEKKAIDEQIQNLRLEMNEVMERKKEPQVKAFSASSMTDKLMSFLDKSIATKERELECPLCLEVSEPPIFMCLESHLICSRCRPKLERCPECRVKYKGKPKRHRYAEKAAEELLELKKEKKELFGN